MCVSPWGGRGARPPASHVGAILPRAPPRSGSRPRLGAAPVRTTDSRRWSRPGRRSHQCLLVFPPALLITTISRRESTMRKKLTITLDERVYEGLHKVVGRRKISGFIESLV